MQRIDDASAEADKFGTGKDGFTEGVPNVTEATIIRGAWLDGIQEEIANVIEGSGAALNGGSYTQLRTALSAIVQGTAYAPTLIRAPDSSGLTASGGNSAAGTNVNGSTGTFQGGTSTGSGYSKAILRAATAGASGTTVRAVEDYLTADGSTGQVTAQKPVALGSTLGVTGAATLSSTLGVADTINATKGSGTGLAVTANATVGGTLVATGSATASSHLIPSATRTIRVLPMGLLQDNTVPTTSYFSCTRGTSRLLSTGAGQLHELAVVLPLPQSGTMTAVRVRTRFDVSGGGSATITVYKRSMSTSTVADATVVATMTPSTGASDATQTLSFSETLDPASTYFVYIANATNSGNAEIGMIECDVTTTELSPVFNA